MIIITLPYDSEAFHEVRHQIMTRGTWQILFAVADGTFQLQRNQAEWSGPLTGAIIRNTDAQEGTS